MIKKISIILTGLFGLLSMNLNAQTIFYTGLGRAVYSMENLTDESISTTDSKMAGGYTIFDLGINANPDEMLRANVILRNRNEAGGFFQQGTSLFFRQMQIEGLLAKKFKYSIGDIFLDQTKYTIWNNDGMYNDFESDMFRLRRDVSHYENFIVDNKWRLQGATLKTELTKFDKGIESLGLKVHGGRTRPTDFTSVPDRFFYGGKLSLKQSKMLEINGNLTGLTDIIGTLETTDVAYKNLVYTSDFKFTVDSIGSLKVVVDGEFGASTFKMDRVSDNTSDQVSDYFYDVQASAIYMPLNLKLGVSYRDVGYNFHSALAQTRRYAEPGNVDLLYFPTLSDGATARATTAFDLYGDEVGVYNQTIYANLMNYYIQYDMVEPYGKATPNRKGLSLNLDLEHKDKIYQVHADASMLSEGVSEGDSVTQALRQFQLIRGGFDINVDKLIGWEKGLKLKYGLRMESSSRDQTNPVDLSSTLIDAGLDVEVFKKFYLSGGIKMFSVKGDEVIAARDELSQITSFTPVSFDEQQTAIVAGFRYQYDKKAFFAVQGNFVNHKDASTSTNSFDFSQLYMIYQMKF